ncbi:cytochrome P450 [Syncephalis pseudoplumigaleata]|uniref:Cytochrome P450 n=1 Tax=Syncephalis pseudoplumigaleata TaxID=1712513 RepID=A0A4P9Z637_9FUNG|nr:cytochrome P450 [Syncephalis pseudoplumigaleata]|eukprot:RKP28056.1 cytochrome P450 [Syncephalis pseudoplumigaleata]
MDKPLSKPVCLHASAACVTALQSACTVGMPALLSLPAWSWADVLVASTVVYVIWQVRIVHFPPYLLANETNHIQLIKHEIQSPLSKIPGPRPVVLASLVYRLNRYVGDDRANVIAIHKKYGPIVRTGRGSVWVSDVDMIRKILGSHNYNKTYYYDAFRFDGDNLFATRDVAYHRVQKRLMLPAYTPSALGNLEPLLYEMGVRRLADVIREHAVAGEAIDLLDLFHCMTFDIIGEVAFGKSFNLLDQGEKKHPIIKWMYATTAHGVKKNLLGPLYHPSLFPKNIEAMDKLREFAMNALAERKAMPDCKRQDTLQQLITAVDEETGATMSDRDIIAEIILLMIAGTDTTAITLTWTMHFLLEHPEAMQRLLAEIKAAYPDAGTKTEHDTIQSMPYLEAVLRESMRLRPIVPQGLSRVVPEEGLTLGGYYLPAGTLVYSSIQTMHLNPEVFPDPTAFKPERWLTSPDQLEIMKRHWVTFSVGPRACIGRK